MAHLLPFFLWIPFIGFLLSLFEFRKKEFILSTIAIVTTSVHLTGVITFILFWLWKANPTLDIKHIVLYKAGNMEIFIGFYFDKITAVFAFVGSLLTFVVAIFSRSYLHREQGFKRFFSTLLLFFLGYNFIIFSGNFETLFVGWEILGVCSFLLITFYRDRYLPVKNGLKVISIYRLGDIGLMLAMWMSHHLWHENITFLKLTDVQLVTQHIQEHNGYVLFIAWMIVIAAAVKSAQLPFSSWLPRAMEGPTSSSAIFYGSLSVHLGIFILLRTYPYWESITIIKIVVILTGIATSIVTINIAKVQSSVKSQIAYSSIAQIGLMFVEVALGFHIIALIHFTGNAFLRTYQLLVSPSVLSYQIHDMFFNFSPKKQVDKSSFLSRLNNSFYILSVKEWNLDFILYRFLWTPFKWIGKKLGFLNRKLFVFLIIVLYLTGVFCNSFYTNIPYDAFKFFPYIFSLIGLMLIIRSFAERGNAIWAWIFAVTGELFIVTSIVFLNENFGCHQMLIYLSGSAISAIVGFVCLQKINRIDNDIDLNQFHGYVYERPVIAFIFFLSCLGLIGLPITPTFIGVDLLFNHIHKHEEIVMIFIALSFTLIEIAVLRIYARIFLGQHKKPYHVIAYRSS